MNRLKQIFQLESIPCGYLHVILRRLLAKFCFDASFLCFLDLLHFLSLLTIFAVDRNFVAYCHAYI